MRFELVNENTCIVYFGDAICESVAEQVKFATDVIRKEMSDVVVDLIPSYTSVLVTYDLHFADRFSVLSRLRTLLGSYTDASQQLSPSREIVIPVYYGPEVALDLEEISAHSGLTPQQVIEIHSQTKYRVYAIGFSPGFAYLGNTDRRIAMSRKQTPRLKVPGGSLGIADTQTAIYPSCSPGGWQIIGRTPLKLIDWGKQSLTLVEVGDRVCFESISKQKYLDLGGGFDEL